MPRRRCVPAVVALAAAVLVSGCLGGEAPTGSPTPAPTPTPTPDFQLTLPASAADVHAALARAGLRTVANTAVADPGGEPRVKLNLQLENWPLIVSEFGDAAAVRRAGRFDPGRPPGSGDPPFAFAGLNILVEYGPAVAGRRPGPPEPRHIEAATRLAEALARIIGPIRERSTVAVAAPPTSPAAATPSSAADSPSPAATPSP